jgi:succinate dehydrogenase / fumarate reductase membrane anchor subunit
MARRNPLSMQMARGSSREGVGHWKLQRLTAISNLILVVWFVISVLALSGANYHETRLWLAQPWNTVMMALLVISTFIHAPLGLQVVIEDYVHHEGAKTAALIAIRLLAVALAVASLIAILRVSLGS